MLDFDRIQALSFDCYGTLVDWEAGILSAMRPILLRHGVACDDDRLLGLYATRRKGSPARPYRTLLRGVEPAPPLRNAQPRRDRRYGRRTVPRQDA